MAVEPILEIIRHRFWQLPPLPFRPLSHGGSGGGKRGNGAQRSRVLRAICERVGLRILREGPGIELLLGFRCRMAVRLRVGARASEMGRRSGPGRGQVTVGGLMARLGGRRERRGEVVGGGEGRVWGGGIGVGGVGIEGRGVHPRPKLVIVVDYRGELVRGEVGGRGVVVVCRAGGCDAVGGGVGLGEPRGVLGVEGGKRSATRVGEMMITERMDWRELDAIVGGRRIERNPRPLVLVEEGRRGVWGVRPLVARAGEGGGVGVDRVGGGGHGSGGIIRVGIRIGETGQVSSTAGRAKICGSLTLTKRQGTREGSVDFGVRYL